MSSVHAAGVLNAGVVIMTQRPAQLVPLSDGPYQVTGALKIIDADGQVLEPPTDTVYLCRCGNSATKSFCDGAHTRRGWTEHDRWTEKKPSSSAL